MAELIIPPPIGVKGLLFKLRAMIDLNHGHYRGMVRMWLAQAEWLLGRLDHWTAPDPKRVHRFVFVCLGNINRSAFAAAVARQQAMHCISIGLSTSTGAPAWHMAVAQAALQGYDLSSHKATDILDYRYREGDLLIVMEVRHAHRLVAHGIPSQAIAMLGYWASPRRIHLHDPHHLPEPYFATCFTFIESAVRRLAQDFPQVKAGG